MDKTRKNNNNNNNNKFYCKKNDYKQNKVDFNQKKKNELNNQNNGEHYNVENRDKKEAKGVYDYENKIDISKGNKSLLSNKNLCGEESDNKNDYEILKKENENLKFEIKNKELEYENKIKKLKKQCDEISQLKVTKYIEEINQKEEVNKKLKQEMKEKEQNIKDIKLEIDEKNKTIQNLTILKKRQENLFKEKETEFKRLKISSEMITNELNLIKKDQKINYEEIGKLKKQIGELENDKFELQKSLENEKKKNILCNSSVRKNDEELSFYKNKFNLIKDIILGKKNLINDKNDNNKMVIEGENEDVEEEEEEVEEYKFDNYNKDSGKVGIDNEELNCYMSSVIQVIKNIKDFSSLILTTNEVDDNIFISFKNLLKSLYYPEKSSVSLIEFKTYFSEKYKRFEGRKDNDSTFFLMYLLQYLQKIIKKTKKKVTNISEFDFLKLDFEEKQELAKFLDTCEQKSHTVLHELFFGYQMSEIICSGCNKVDVSFQSYNILHLSLFDDMTKLTSLEQCINSFLYTKDKKGSEGFECSNCKRKCLSHVISIIKLPPILIINLKRVGERNIYNHDIKIPYILKTNNIEKLDKFNLEYELIGYIKHFGSAQSGHNVAYTKNIFDKKWYCFNDDQVEQIYNHSTKGSFLLFYQLIKN